MFLIVDVTSWQDTRDSSYRVAPLDKGSREFLINPNRIQDLKVGDDSTLQVPTSWFKFYDNVLDRRENSSYVKTRTAKSTITTAADTAFFSSMITLPICRNNNPDKPTTDYTLPVSSIAYADRYNPDPTHYCWVCYVKGAFRRVEVLTKLSIEKLEDIAETGSTSTSTTTTDR